MPKSYGFMAYNFDDIAHLGVDYFSNIYEEGWKVTLVRVVNITTFFPNFVSENDNENLLE